MSSEERPEAVIDFRALPIAEAASLLRSLGGYLLACALEGVQPQLKDRLSPGAVRLLISSTGYSPRLGRRLYAGQSWGRILPALIWNRLRRVLRRDRRFSYSKTVEHRIHGRLSPDAYVARVGDELEHRFERYHGYRFPNDFWALLGEYAWGDLEFQRKAAEKLEQKIRSRTLFSADLDPDAGHEARRRHFPTMLLSPNLFWLMLAMAISGVQLNWTYRILPSRHRTRKAFRLLQTESLRHGLRPSWANVWDQWVLLEALKHWKESQIPELLQPTLDNLPFATFRADRSPLIEMAEGDLAPDKVGSPVQIALDDWQEKMPGWFAEWNRLSS